MNELSKIQFQTTQDYQRPGPHLQGGRGRHSHGAQGIDPGGVCRVFPQTERYGAAEGS